MTLIKCDNGHFFDKDKFPSCPHCNPVEAKSAEKAGNPMVDFDKPMMGNIICFTDKKPFCSEDPIIHAYLIRVKNNEKILIDKPVFKIGRKAYVDYDMGDNKTISHYHASFITRDGEYFVVDTNSINHTFVNEIMIPSNEEIKIHHGDKIRLANEDLIFNIKSDNDSVSYLK